MKKELFDLDIYQILFFAQIIPIIKLNTDLNNNTFVYFIFAV